MIPEAGYEDDSAVGARPTGWHDSCTVSRFRHTPRRPPARGTARPWGGRIRTASGQRSRCGQAAGQRAEKARSTRPVKGRKRRSRPAARPGRSKASSAERRRGRRRIRRTPARRASPRQTIGDPWRIKSCSLHYAPSRKAPRHSGSIAGARRHSTPARHAGGPCHSAGKRSSQCAARGRVRGRSPRRARSDCLG